METINKATVILSGKGKGMNDKIDKVLLDNGLLFSEERGGESVIINEYNAEYMNGTFKELDAEISKIRGLTSKFTTYESEDPFDMSLRRVNVLEISAV